MPLEKTWKSPMPLPATRSTGPARNQMEVPAEEARAELAERLVMQNNADTFAVDAPAYPAGLSSTTRCSGPRTGL